MGGKGSGGHRVGSGRKPKDSALGALTGSRRTRSRAKQQNQIVASNQTAPVPSAASDLRTSEPVSAVEIPQPPGSLTLDELAEWNDLAPRAAKAGTLSDGTMLALRDLCQARVLKDRLLRSIENQGDVVLAATGNLAAHPLIARFTTLLQRVDAGMARFGLAPMGKEVEKPAQIADPFAEFDRAGTNASDQRVN